MVALGAGCGSKGGGGPDDKARLDACVLMGATTNDGCDTNGASPAIKLGDLTIGTVRTRDVALYNGGAGEVPATVGAVALEGATGNYAILKIFRLDAAQAEVPVTLPFDLAVNHGSELRVRVAYTANAAVGAVGAAALRVTASHPSTAAVIPFTGQITGCPEGLGDCDGDLGNGCEVDLATSLEHCGACAAACGSGNASATCDAGACQIACDAGFGNCDGSAANGCETDLLADAGHCSACGNACDATNGTATCGAGACGISCAVGFGDCDGDPANGCEADFATDAGNCGACGGVCGSVNGTGTCSASLCVTSCDPGFANCDGSPANGCEADLSSTATCGACGNACSSGGGTASCAAGTCRITCDAAWADCDGSVANGCEATPPTDPPNCGACGNVCNGTNGTATCSASTCGVTCSAGFGDCDGSAANGCEVDTRGDAANCGACGNACSAVNGVPSCGNGACAIACTAPFESCDGNAATGCEVNLSSDVTNCGACGTACGTANAAATCGGGSCGLVCQAGYFDCDGLNADGCEVNALFDPANCGGCGLACTLPNATPACAAGFCAVAACDAGFADCNAQQADGCETSIAGDPNNCGGCGNVCVIANGTAACGAGACAVAACDAGWADCNGKAEDGCEVKTASDVGNCGACGNVCPGVANGTPTCGGGTCGVGACNAGFADCDGLPANGCETNTTSDLANCGACGNACTVGPNATGVACAASTCAITACAGGWFNIDGSAANGCECQDDGVLPTVCSAAPGYVVSVPAGGTSVVSGNILPRAGGEHWFQVNFSGVGGPGAYFHPRITFVSNPLSAYKLAVVGSICGPLLNGCGALLDTFEMTFPANPNGCSGFGNCQDATARPTTAYVRVVQVASLPTTTCGGFSIQASNQ